MKAGMEWEFGGWLHGVHPAVAWSILGLIALTGLALIAFSYQRTLRKLPARARWGLTALRTALLAGILLCLANPVRVDKNTDDKNPSRKLAVLVDRSASMDAMDNRKETRLGNALSTCGNMPQRRKRDLTSSSISDSAKIRKPRPPSTKPPSEERRRGNPSFRCSGADSCGRPGSSRLPDRWSRHDGENTGRPDCHCPAQWHSSLFRRRKQSFPARGIPEYQGDQITLASPPPNHVHRRDHRGGCCGQGWRDSHRTLER